MDEKEKNNDNYVDDDFFDDGQEEKSEEPVVEASSSTANSTESESSSDGYYDAPKRVDRSKPIYIDGIPYYASGDVARRENAAARKNRYEKPEPKTWMQVVSILLFVLSICVIFFGFIGYTIALINSPYPGISPAIESFSAFFYFLPIPIASLIIGIVFTCMKYRCLKNIITGSIVMVILFFFGSMSFTASAIFSHDMAKLDEISEKIKIDFPDDGVITIEDTTGMTSYVEDGARHEIRTIDVVFNKGDKLTDFESRIETDIVDWRPVSEGNVYSKFITDIEWELMYENSYTFMNVVQVGSSEYYILAYDMVHDYLNIKNFIFQEGEYMPDGEDTMY